MAAAFLRDFSPRLEVVSAGRHPAERLQPLMVAAMRECLIDLDGEVPHGLSEYDPSHYTLYECPDHPCPNSIGEIRNLRDKIKNDSFLFYRTL